MPGMSDQQQNSRNEMLAVLEWYRAAGVDVCVGDDPVNRLARPAVSASAVSGGRQGKIVAPAPANMAEAHGAASLSGDASEARQLAANAKNLGELRLALEGYEGCSLKLRATRMVFADGNEQARIMLVGEAPGREEDLDGRPFVGRSGQLLDAMLAAIGLDRTGVYIANTVPWRPPGNRTPSPLEVAQCLPFLHRQIELVAPEILITLGAAATQTMFEARLAITKVRGQWRDLKVGRHEMRALACLHPAFLLRQPAQKRQAWLDMLSIARAMEEIGIEPSINHSSRSAAGSGGETRI